MHRAKGAKAVEVCQDEVPTSRQTAGLHFQPEHYKASLHTDALSRYSVTDLCPYAATYQGGQ